MGINCLYAFKYKKMYYVFMKGNEPYPKELGISIVTEIRKWKKTDIKEMQQWIEQINVTETNGPEIFDTLESAVKNPKEHSFYKCCELPELYIGIGWIYLIDFDKNHFIVKWLGDKYIHKQLFFLNYIPKSWYNLIEGFD
jgi:hypothetical protein